MTPDEGVLLLMNEIRAFRVEIQNLPDRIASAIAKEADRVLTKVAIWVAVVYLIIKAIDWLRSLLS
jgi:hypothetical protein